MKKERRRHLMRAVDSEHLKFAEQCADNMRATPVADVPLDQWWRICGHCLQATQMGMAGLRAHTVVCHPYSMTLAAHPDPRRKPPWEPTKTSSSTQSRPRLTVVSSSPTDDSQGTSARTD